MQPLTRAVLGVALGALGLPANAQGAAPTYPARPIRLVVPLPPGGGVDWMARQTAQKLGERIGQQVIVDNRAGASGNIGMEVVAKSTADGYTLVLGLTAHYAVNPSLFAKLPYDPVRDFAPVMLVAATPLVLLVHPNVAARSVKELVALARARGGKLAYASGGNGSASHLAGEMLKSMAGIDMLHVPYKGLAPAIAALVGEQVQVSFGVWSADSGHVKAGRLRVLAVTTAKRSRALSDLPSIAETVPGYDLSVWYGVAAPARTPREVVQKLNSELLRVLADPEYRQRIEAEGIEPIGSTPEQLGDYIKSETAKWAKVVRESGVKLD
ncbi:MAG: tripartite tricarboxylate transporter substrate binding protein [Burkholderiales bacterium]|nr:tripartite tricarboxylate transporter substrate binding protein [Burkholderiales bacterium]